MKKGLYRALLILVVLLITASPVFAAADRSLSLSTIANLKGKEVVFTFIPRGEFKASELNGYVWVHGQKFTLSCRLNDRDEVKCIANQSLYGYIGMTAVGSVAGFPFSGLIIDLSSVRNYCPTIWQASGNSWVAGENLCSTFKPVNGDWILLDDGSIAFYNDNGPAGPGFYGESNP